MFVNYTLSRVMNEHREYLVYYHDYWSSGNCLGVVTIPQRGSLIANDFRQVVSEINVSLRGQWERGSAGEVGGLEAAENPTSLPLEARK